MMRILDDYYTREELAHTLGKGAKTLERWRSQEKGPPFITLGRNVLYPRDEVRKWLAGLKTKPQF
jgi:predicted DNA-binding transcriptional regulator AlpA